MHDRRRTRTRRPRPAPSMVALKDLERHSGTAVRLRTLGPRASHARQNGGPLLARAKSQFDENSHGHASRAARSSKVFGASADVSSQKMYFVDCESIAAHARSPANHRQQACTSHCSQQRSWSPSATVHPSRAGAPVGLDTPHRAISRGGGSGYSIMRCHKLLFSVSPAIAHVVSLSELPPVGRHPGMATSSLRCFSFSSAPDGHGRPSDRRSRRPGIGRGRHSPSIFLSLH